MKTLNEMLDYIADHCFKDFKTASMSWITFNDHRCDESGDYCPECAQKKVEELEASGEYKPGELTVKTDNSVEDDGCRTCDVCGIPLECCSLGTFVMDEIHYIEDSGPDVDVLWHLLEARGNLDEVSAKEAERVLRLRWAEITKEFPA